VKLMVSLWFFLTPDLEMLICLQKFFNKKIACIISMTGFRPICQQRHTFLKRSEEEEKEEEEEEEEEEEGDL
jgi:hypothetical protein